jgi:hypothetical protein
MIKLIQIVPKEDERLYGLMVKKEIELSRKNKGSFYRSASKEHNRAKWTHKSYKGWIKLQRAEGEVVTVEIRSLSQSEDEWQIFHAFLGWLDRHFSDKIQSINVQYRD